MALFKKLVVLAITSGVVKKAWEAWRSNRAMASGGGALRRRAAQDKPTTDRGYARWSRDHEDDKPGPR